RLPRRRARLRCLGPDASGTATACPIRGRRPPAHEPSAPARGRVAAVARAAAVDKPGSKREPPANGSAVRRGGQARGRREFRESTANPFPAVAAGRTAWGLRDLLPGPRGAAPEPTRGGEA